MQVGVDINIRDHSVHQRTLITSAAFRRQYDVVEYLLKNRADIDARDWAGSKRNSLLWALHNQYEDIAELLILKGANVELF